MRNLLPAVLLLAGAASSLHAAPASNADDERYVVLSQATPHDRLFAILFDRDRGIAVGEAGLVETSDDGGKTWARQEPPTHLAITDVASNGTRTIAVGQMGLVLVRDGDGAWRKIDSGTERRLLQVDLNKNGLAIITGAFGTLLKSADAGETWTNIAPNWATLYYSGEGDTAVIRDEPTNYVVDVIEDGSIFIAGEYGQIMRSPDGGNCWEVVYRHPSESGQAAPTVFSMRIRDDGIGYAVGQAGMALRTADGGHSWTELKTSLTGSLFAVESFQDGQVFAVGQRAAVYSPDSGATWRPIKALDLTLNWYSGLAYSASAPAGEVVAVGHGARVIKLSPP